MIPQMLYMMKSSLLCRPNLRQRDAKLKAANAVANSVANAVANSVANASTGAASVGAAATDAAIVIQKKGIINYNIRYLVYKIIYYKYKT